MGKITGRYKVVFRMVNGLKHNPQVSEGPFIISKPLGTLYNISEVDAYEVRGEWIAIVFEGKKGYVRVSKGSEVFLRKL